MRKVLSVIAILASGSVAWAKDAPAVPTIEASIEWTALGIPHIQAFGERSLGYGIGYAYAQDNICLLADEVLTVRGERAEFFGREGQSSAQLGNLDSDFFFRWLNTDAAVAKFRQAQPEPIRQLLSGYAAGFNRYLRDVVPETLPVECRRAVWLRPLTEDDVIRLIRRLLVEGGIGRFAEAVVTAAPPIAGKAIKPDVALIDLRGFALTRGSNAIAVGGRRTENGKGRLLANPHFPWSGGLRFYQMHLTIPGRLDVMGAALPGFPVINIGFNRNLAWTHTVDASSHFTLHRLHLDAKNPLHYIVDGQVLPLQKTAVSIQVRESTGQLSTQTRTVYESRFGPVIAAEGMAWSGADAVALQDPNLANTRALAQWYAMNQAYNLTVFRKTLLDIQGVPWVNTLAVDDRGQALYMNVSVVPNIPVERLAACADKALQAMGLPALDGSRAFCNGQPDAQAAQPGIVAGNRMPSLQRDDYLQNSNDSAWLSNPAAPLIGFSPLISAQDRPLRLRTRYALTQLAAQGEKPLTEDFLKRLVTDNHVYAADLILDDLLAFCRSQRSDRDVARACAALGNWDRAANSDSGLGLLYFQAFMASFEENGIGWRQPFNPNDPLHTPHGMDWATPAVADSLKKILIQAAHRVEALKLPANTVWGDIQGVQTGTDSIPIPGGDGGLGIYNAIERRSPLAAHSDVMSGSSYIQLVSFDEQGPVAHGLLTFSQSSNPASPHFLDQTRLFSQKKWPLLPFTSEQIQTNPPVRRLQLRE